MKIGDLVLYRKGRQVWTIVQIIESNGYTWARCVNKAGTKHLHGYLEDLRLAKVN